MEPVFFFLGGTSKMAISVAFRLDVALMNEHGANYTPKAGISCWKARPVFYSQKVGN